MADQLFRSIGLRTDVQAIVHTHSPNATALACAHRGLPAFHDMIARAPHDKPGGRSREQFECRMTVDERTELLGHCHAVFDSLGHPLSSPAQQHRQQGNRRRTMRAEQTHIGFSQIRTSKTN